MAPCNRTISFLALWKYGNTNQNKVWDKEVFSGNTKTPPHEGKKGERKGTGQESTIHVSRPWVQNCHCNPACSLTFLLVTYFASGIKLLMLSSFGKPQKFLKVRQFQTLRFISRNGILLEQKHEGKQQEREGKAQTASSKDKSISSRSRSIRGGGGRGR